jgi:hypothetical protein
VTFVTFVAFVTVAVELRDLVTEDDDAAVTGLHRRPAKACPRALSDIAASDATIGGRA